MYSVDQINIDLSPFEDIHFEKLKKFIFQPKAFSTFIDKINDDMSKDFTHRLFYDKLKQQGRLEDPEFVYIYDREFMESRKTNLPSVYLKAHSTELVKLAGSLKSSSISGLVIKAPTIEVASTMFKEARSHPGLAKVDLQVEVEVESLDDVKRLKEIGFSKVQIPGSYFFQKVIDSLL